MDEIKQYHVPVLCRETIDALDLCEGKIAVDCTAGGGGHSSEILKKIGTSGTLVDIDRDPDAITAVKSRFAANENVIFVQDEFKNIKTILSDLNIDGADAILADLGVSSHQIDTADRGFSFHKDARLDMRMSQTGFSAYDAVNTLSYEELTNILYKYGEEKYAPSICAKIVKQREKAPIETTFELAELVANSVPMKARRDGHPARKTFQALRIYVNHELDTLENSISDMFESLNVGGVLAIISFHSLEDRIVKMYFRDLTQGCTCPKDFPVCVCGKTPRAEFVVRKKDADDDEIEENSRARTARLRAVRKLKD